ncbi:MAG: hypothetical protein IPG74_15105 [Flavobacteriales bacterium]|nr:hypothetical protein [Flavobacteriales bacterium]
MIFHLAAMGSDVTSKAKGYLVSDDRAFRYIQGHELWGNKGRVHIPTRGLSTLASLVCGIGIEDDDMIHMLFNPIIVASAEYLKRDIHVLASLGIDLKNKPLDRLEWDVKHELSASIDAFRLRSEQGVVVEMNSDLGTAALQVAKAARALGYGVAAPVNELINDYARTKAAIGEEARKRETLENQFKALIEIAVGGSKKGKQRVNKALRDMGIILDPPHDDESEGIDN